MPRTEIVERSKPKPGAAAWAHKVAIYIFFIAVAGAPLPFGSRDATTVALWCGLLGIGLICASPRQLRAGHFAVLAGIALVVAGYGVVLHEQLALHPWVAAYNPIWARASEVLGKEILPSVSIVRDEPFYALGPALANVLVLALGLIVGADSERARQTLLVIAWSGAAYAIFGILSLLLEPTMILWREKTAYVGNLTGTFINRNTAATYFGSCAAVWLVLFLRRFRGRLPKGPIEWKKVPGRVLSEDGSNRDIVIRFVMLFVCLAAMFMTSSRAGVLVSLLVLVIAFVVFFRRDLPRGKSLVVAVLCAGAVALLILQVMGGNIGQRLDVQGLADEGRLSAWRSTLRLIADTPWFGTGLGTFAWAFPPYRGDDMSMVSVWDRAHSTPLELAAELGIPLTALIALAWIVALVVLVRGARRGGREAVVALAALAVSLIALLHSCIDFSLQVAGYAIVVFGLLGVALAQSVHAPVQPGQANENSRQRHSHKTAK